MATCTKYRWLPGHRYYRYRNYRYRDSNFRYTYRWLPGHMYCTAAGVQELPQEVAEARDETPPLQVPAPLPPGAPP